MSIKGKKVGKPRGRTYGTRRDLLNNVKTKTIIKLYKALKRKYLTRKEIKDMILKKKEINYLTKEVNGKIIPYEKIKGIEIEKYEETPQSIDRFINKLLKFNILFQKKRGLYPYEYETKEFTFGEHPEINDIRKYKIEAYCLDEYYVLMALKDIYNISISLKLPAMLELISSFNKPFKIKKEMYWIKLSEEKKQKTLEINIKVSPDWKAYINDEYDEGSIDDIFKEYIKKYWDKRNKKSSIGQSKINYYDEQGFHLMNVKGYSREAPTCRRCIIGILRKKGDNTWECDKCQKVISQNEFEKDYKEEC